MMHNDPSNELSDDRVTPELLGSETVFAGRVWNVDRERFQLDGSAITREFVNHTGAVAVLAMDERDRVLLIKQYRHPVRLRDWELPAGLLDVLNESPLIAAQRELAEETDLQAESWHVLSEMLTSPGGSNEAVRIYLARGVSATGDVFERYAEEAGIELRWVPLDEAVEAVLQRRVQNSILCVGVMAAQLGRDRGWNTLGDANAPWPRHPRNYAE
ncbi:NUDIX hydrolase [Salinibacterium sp. SWN1162]|uniref:NUDIX domain-containing protein n=1 Tax=Salinibacterium sp. SWN1162 TaxID=2792053 RepID=UPI0018CF352B|nr:NUDIX hydrolase [Salinibacterium sp. SWN1162]MBH0009597.1 NUDIX hydrolase [Salinibacterium sp. SWN1162]